MKRGLLIGLSLCMVLVFGQAAGAAQKKMTIGMINLFNQAAYFTGMDVAVKQEAEKAGVEVISTDAGFDAAKLASDVEDVLAQGVDGLIISAGPTETLPAVMDAIEEAGVPVVFVDRLWKNTDLSTPWNWVGAQNTYMGEQLGLYIKDRLIKEGKSDGFVVILRGGPADNSIGLDRTNGMISSLEGTDITYERAPDFSDWGEDKGFTAMANMLARFEKINAVFCENDSTCLGAQKAIADAGRSEEMFLAASDAGKGTLKEMMTDGSNFGATALNDSDQIGRVGFDHLMKLLKGEKLENITPLPSPLILKEDAPKYYDPNKVF